MSSKLVGSRMRYCVQADSAQVPTCWGLQSCGRLRAWRSRSTTALLLRTNTNTGNKGRGPMADMAVQCLQRSYMTCMDVRQTSVTATLLLTIDIKHVSLRSISSSSSSSAKGGLGGASKRSDGGGKGGGGGRPVDNADRNV